MIQSQRNRRPRAAVGARAAAATLVAVAASAALSAGCLESTASCDSACYRSALFVLQPPVDAETFTVTVVDESTQAPTTSTCTVTRADQTITCTNYLLWVTLDDQQRLQSVGWTSIESTGALDFQLTANGQTTQQTFTDPPRRTGEACGTTCYAPQQFIVAN